MIKLPAPAHQEGRASPATLPQAVAAGGALHSPQWFRVARRCPLLQPQVQVQRLVSRGEVWHTLVLEQGQRSFRLNAAAWAAVARCDGAHTLQQIWDATQAAEGPLAPTQDELLAMLARLHEAGLLSFDGRPDFGTTRITAADPAAATQAVKPGAGPRRQSLLAWRLPLGNPDRLLGTLLRWLRAALPGTSAGPVLALLWLLALLAALWTAVLHQAEVAAQLRLLLAAPQGWGWAALAYPLMKLLHEAAHGLAARYHGCTVREWGISWLMLVPVPYVDASAASALPRRRQRLLVAGAGIAVELSVAALALALALAVQPGALRDTALLVFALAGLSTVAVNANPLLRFDGYHMLCDALSLPNLGARSSRHWLQLMQRGSLQGRPGSALQPARGETAWLWAYAPAALAMRWAVASAVVMWLGSLSQMLGLLALAGFGYSLLLQPCLKLLAWLRQGGWQQLGSAAPGRPLSATQCSLVLAPLVLAGALLWPVPVSTVVEGVLAPPEEALVRAQTAGFVEQVMVADGQAVAAGDPVLQLHAPELLAQHQRQLGRVQDLQAERARTLRDEAASAAATEHALQSARAELDLTEQRLQQLTVRAATAGRIAIDHAADLPGRHLPRGALVAQVLGAQPGTVVVAIPNEHAARLVAAGTLVQLRGPERDAQPRAGRWLGALSGGQAELPSAALGQRSGGRLAVDPNDPRGLRPAQAVLLGQVELLPLPAGAEAGPQPAPPRVGQRMRVRFEQGRAPLLVQAAQAVQQQLLRHFNPAT